jgi:hypothetical protein
MEVEFVEALAKLRMTIGYLGEKDQFAWWQSSFFTHGSDSFLSPLFGRTQLLAQCNGVTRAASLIHDERIGIGVVYHLFRLPEDIEQNIHKKLHEIQTLNILSNKETALSYLRKYSSKLDQPSIGPTLIGDKTLIHNIESWKKLSGFYLYAFENAVEIYPYFSGIA